MCFKAVLTFEIKSVMKKHLDTKRFLLAQDGDIAYIMGSDIDKKKLCSSMTLFRAAAPEIPVFDAVLQKFFGGKADGRTLGYLAEH